jgi:hypothetical protein
LREDVRAADLGTAGRLVRVARVRFAGGCSVVDVRWLSVALAPAAAEPLSLRLLLLVSMLGCLSAATVLHGRTHCAEDPTMHQISVNISSMKTHLYFANVPGW